MHSFKSSLLITAQSEFHLEGEYNLRACIHVPHRYKSHFYMGISAFALRMSLGEWKDLFHYLFLQVGSIIPASGLIWWAHLCPSCHAVVVLIPHCMFPLRILTQCLSSFLIPHGLVTFLTFITVGCLSISAMHNSSILCCVYSVSNYI